MVTRYILLALCLLIPTTTTTFITPYYDEPPICPAQCRCINGAGRNLHILCLEKPGEPSGVEIKKLMKKTVTDVIMEINVVCSEFQSPTCKDVPWYRLTRKTSDTKKVEIIGCPGITRECVFTKLGLGVLPW